MAEKFTAGVYRVLLWLVNSTGYSTGQQTTLANGATSSAWVLDGARDWNVPNPNFNIQRFEGGDARLGSMIFGDSGVESFDILFDVLPIEIIAAALGLTIDDTTNSVWRMWSAYTQGANLANIGVAVVQRQKNRVTGQKQFNTTMFPLGEATFFNLGGTYQTKRQVRMQFAPSQATYLPNGVEIADLATNMPDGKGDFVYVEADHPLQITTMRGDATATTFITPYRPISTVVTAGATPNWFARNRTPAALASVVTTTGVHTMSAAGVAGDYNVVIGETDYVPI